MIKMIVAGDSAGNQHC